MLNNITTKLLTNKIMKKLLNHSEAELECLKKLIEIVKKN